MPSWGWRITFIVGAILTFISYHLRKNMIETPDFEEIKNTNKIKDKPLIEVIRSHKIILIQSFSISSCAYIFLYITTIYLNSLYIDTFKVSYSLSLIISTFIILTWMILTPLAGFFADKIGILSYLKKIVLLALFLTFPSYYLACYYKSFFSFLFLQFFLSAIGSLIFGPVPGLLKQVFETEVRFTGISLSNTIAQATLGGFSPFYSAFLISITGLEYSPAFILSFACILGYVGLRKLNI